MAKNKDKVTVKIEHLDIFNNGEYGYYVTVNNEYGLDRSYLIEENGYIPLRCLDYLYYLQYAFDYEIIYDLDRKLLGRLSD